MRILNVGIIGFGFSGQTFHTQLIKSLPFYKITKVYSSDKEKVKIKLPEVVVTATPEELIHSSDLDLIVIATPSYNHFELASLALKAGKNVVIEKPFVLNLDQASQLKELAISKSKTIAVFHNRRWDSDFLTIKKVLSENKLGEIHLFESRFDRFRPTVIKDRWREKNGTGGGSFYDIAPHLLDQALNLFGMPDQVQADIGKTRAESMADDYFRISLYYPNLTAILSSSSMVMHSPRFTIHGMKASLIKYGRDTQETALKQDLKPDMNMLSNWGIEDEASKSIIYQDGNQVSITSENGNYLNFYLNLYDVLEKGGTLEISLDSAIKVTKIMDDCLTSAKTGSKVLC